MYLDSTEPYKYKNTAYTMHSHHDLIIIGGASDGFALRKKEKEKVPHAVEDLYYKAPLILPPIAPPCRTSGFLS
jgi:hypothetical protein